MVPTFPQSLSCLVSDPFPGPIYLFRIAILLTKEILVRKVREDLLELNEILAYRLLNVNYCFKIICF